MTQSRLHVISYFPAAGFIHFYSHSYHSLGPSWNQEVMESEDARSGLQEKSPEWQ